MCPLTNIVGSQTIQSIPINFILVTQNQWLWVQQQDLSQDQPRRSTIGLDTACGRGEKSTG